MRKTTKREEDFWDKVLKDHQLGMDRGRSSKVDYVGNVWDLARPQDSTEQKTEE